MARRGHGWMEGLRRDRGLFALAGIVVMLAGLLQPLAEARAADTANAWVICTTFGMVKADPAGGVEPVAGAADDCPLCIAGHHCGAAPASSGLDAGVAAWPAPQPARLSRLAPGRASPPSTFGDPPPAIRAPPFSV